MIRSIVRDPLLLSQKSEKADQDDLWIARDLLDTLRAHLDGCVGMATNMIGEKKRIIAVCLGPMQAVMLNPEIVAASGPYEAEEGCLSLDGKRKAMRYQNITVRYRDMDFRERTGRFQGFAAQIIQHEIDHCEGILI